MRFCKQCGSVMVKNATDAGEIVFTCACTATEPGNARDTLMSEVFYETVENTAKHDVFIENSPFDPAAHIVLEECPGCKLNFMTMIQVGQNETTMYTCTCGYRATRAEYLKRKA